MMDTFKVLAKWASCFSFHFCDVATVPNLSRTLVDYLTTSLWEAHRGLLLAGKSGCPDRDKTYYKPLFVRWL